MVILLYDQLAFLLAMFQGNLNKRMKSPPWKKLQGMISQMAGACVYHHEQVIEITQKGEAL